MPTPSKPSPCVGIRTCSDYSPFGVELDGRIETPLGNKENKVENINKKEKIN